VEVSKVEPFRIPSLVEALRGRLAKETATRDELAEKHPRFTVRGDITDRDETSLVIWGCAFSSNPRYQNDWRAVPGPGNIVVDAYEKRNVHGNGIRPAKPV